MSSDESTSTQLSTISSRCGTEQKLKNHKSEQWEINFIGNFLLTLYHRQLIVHQNDWIIKKSDIRKEFGNFLNADLSKKFKELNGTDNIGTLLHRCGFLHNTTRGSPFYKIKNIALFQFRNKKLKEEDDWRINNDVKNNAKDQTDENLLHNLMEKETDIKLEENFEFDEYATKNLLDYQGTTMQQRKPNYRPTNMSCVICEEDFSAITGYEDHLQKHNDETEFEYLETLSKFDSPIFNVSYSLCKNSHYFCFDIETKTENLVIEKIIIVQSRSLYYVHNTRVPYDMPATGHEQFFVDSHLFTIYVEKPIVLICHLKDNKDTRIIEEHHFMRCVEFPKVNFPIKPYRLPCNKTFKSIFELPDYFPPKEIQEALKSDFYNEQLMKTSNEFREYIRNEKKLQLQTIKPSLTILLQIEDFDTIKQYFNLTQHNIKLRNFGDNYSFKLRPRQRIFVENILSVLDEVILIPRSNISTNPEDLLQLILANKDDLLAKKRTYVGQIEDVNSGRVIFKCTRRIDLKSTYTVVCRPSRLNIRYQYRSLEMLSPETMPFLKKFLFPAQLIPSPLSTISLTLYNKTIIDNPEQLQAVRNIAEGPRNDATYIIFGPPGTGKTTTIVEAILQLLKRSETKILVTASSNSACDEVAIRLCEKLKELDMKRAIVRIYSRSAERRVDTIDDELLENSNMYNGQFYPDIEVLHEYRIVVSTLSIVAKLATGKFGRQSNGQTLYTHLFIDEVAASMEVEALIAITTILTPKSSLVIAGDHKQLGPILKSKRAEELGLGVSLMERLLARECYRVNSDNGDYDRTIQTRLKLNFRSHPEIVNLFNGLYYDHSLEAKANIDDLDLVKHWHLSPNKEYPIIFHCIDTASCKDNQSQSLYNLQELNVVMDYVKDLMYFGINGNSVDESDIGIISPYKKQYKLIKEELNLRKWFKIETGSVETFQGKEKSIIIVSFVRSGTSTLGFLENPRRLNVTISRPKSLLIMIGNPQTLSLNGDFAYIIKECQRHNTLVGSMKRDNNNANDAKRQNHKRFNKSTEKLNMHQKGSKDNNNNIKVEQSNATKIAALNKSMEGLNVTDAPKDINQKSRRRGRGRGGRGERRGRGGRNDRRNINQSDDKNKERNDSEDDDDDDDDNNSDVDSNDDDDNKPSTSKAASAKLDQNIKTHHNARGQRNSGKISKQYNKGSKTISTKSTKIESLFNDLPQVPRQTSTTTTTTAESLRTAIAAQINNIVTPTIQQQQHQQQQHQQQHYNNQQQQNYNNQQQHFYNMPMNHRNYQQLSRAYNQQYAAQQMGRPTNFMQPQMHPMHMQQHQQNPYGYNPISPLLSLQIPPYQNNSILPNPFINQANHNNNNNNLFNMNSTGTTGTKNKQSNSNNSSNAGRKQSKTPADIRSNSTSSNKRGSNNKNNWNSNKTTAGKTSNKTGSNDNNTSGTENLRQTAVVTPTTNSNNANSNKSAANNETKGKANDRSSNKSTSNNNTAAAGTPNSTTTTNNNNNSNKSSGPNNKSKGTAASNANTNWRQTAVVTPTTTNNSNNNNSNNNSNKSATNNESKGKANDKSGSNANTTAAVTPTATKTNNNKSKGAAASNAITNWRQTAVVTPTTNNDNNDNNKNKNDFNKSAGNDEAKKNTMANFKQTLPTPAPRSSITANYSRPQPSNNTLTTSNVNPTISANIPKTSAVNHHLSSTANVRSTTNMQPGSSIRATSSTNMQPASSIRVTSSSSIDNRALTIRPTYTLSDIPPFRQTSIGTPATTISTTMTNVRPTTRQTSTVNPSTAATTSSISSSSNMDNQRPIIRQTSTVNTPTAATTSSALSSSSIGYSNNYTTPMRTNYSTGIPPHEFQGYEDYRRPVRNLQFDNRPRTPENEKSSCIIS